MVRIHSPRPLNFLKSLTFRAVEAMALKLLFYCVAKNVATTIFSLTNYGIQLQSQVSRLVSG